MIYRCDVALRVFSSTRSVGEISRLLGTEADEARKRGTAVSPCNPRSPIREESLWVRRRSADGEGCVERCLDEIAEFAHVRAQRPVRLEDCEADVAIGVFTEDWQSNFVLGHAALFRFAALGLDVLVSVYGPDGELDGDRRERR